MSPEKLNYSASDPEHPLIRSLAEQLDEETLAMSGGFGELDGFKNLVGFGEAALPILLDSEDLRWWRLQAICQIADKLGKPIEFPKEAPGMYGVVHDTITEWGKKYGYSHPQTK